MLPTVSVIVPTLGKRPQWLALALASIEQQEYPVEVVVVGPAHAQSDIRVANAIWIAQSQIGLSNAINDGLRHVESEFVTWLGDDDLLAPGALRSGVDALTHHAQAPFAYGRTRYIDADGKTLFCVRPSRVAWRWLRIGMDFVPQPGSLMRSACVAAAGGVDSGLRSAMDLDLFLRLSHKGRPVYIPQELSAYRLHPESITVSKRPEDRESATVQDRYRSPRASRVLRKTAPLIRSMDRWFLRANKLAGCSAPPLWDSGEPYTGSSESPQ